MLLVSREWQATARKTSCLQKRDSGNIPLNRADVSSRNFDSLAGFGAIFPRYHRSGINIIFKSVSPEQPWCVKEPFSAPFFSFTVYDFFFLFLFLPSHATNMSSRFVYSSRYLFLVACSHLGWVKGMASARRMSGMLRRDITEKRSSSPDLPFPVGTVFSLQVDVAEGGVLETLCDGRSRSLVKTSCSSQLPLNAAIYSSQDFLK